MLSANPANRFSSNLILHALSEVLDLSAPDHKLIDLLDDCIALSFGILIPADKRIAALVVLFPVLGYPGILGDQHLDRFGFCVQAFIRFMQALAQVVRSAADLLYFPKIRQQRCPVTDQLIDHPPHSPQRIFVLKMGALLK